MLSAAAPVCFQSKSFKPTSQEAKSGKPEYAHKHVRLTVSTLIMQR
jgi:hypothetical protein